MKNVTKNIKIFQTSKRGIAFFSREDLNIDLEKDEYKKVYELNITIKDNMCDDSILEDLFVTFNVNHPNDYKARSLSVSDIIEIDNSYYICQSFGWDKINIKRD